MAKLNVSKLNGRKQPFDEVKVVTFSFSPKDREETAFMQYNLLLKPEILQAHLDTESKKGKLICVPAFDIEGVLNEFGLRVKFSSVEWISYKEYRARNASCSL